MADTNYKRYRCGFCTLEFESQKPKQYCSKKCNKAYIKKHKTSVSRAEYLAKVRENAVSRFICEHCGKESFRSLSGTNKSRGTGNRFCSMSCRSLYAQAQEAKRLEEARRHRAIVAPEIEALRRIARYVEKPALVRANCCHCDALMIVRRGCGRPRVVCDACTKAAIKAARAIAKAKRRAAASGVYAQSINPFAVFDRDKWTCKLCGVKTPRKLRGTYEPNAPELDHIIPLSKGGMHVMTNVQCACRKCNGRKSDRPLGQLLLIG